MAKKVSRSKGKKSKNGLGVAKKKNILHNKLRKEGVFGKEAKKKRRKEKRVEQRRKYEKHLETVKKRLKHWEPDYEPTGEEMIEMMDPEDFEAVIDAHKKRKKKEAESFKFENVEKQPRSFNYEDETVEKDLLPVRSEQGWEDRKIQVAKVSKNKKQQEDEDSGVCEEDSAESDDEFAYLLPKNKKNKTELSVAEILAERARNLKNKKVKMASLAMNVVQQPELLSNLKGLMNMLFESDVSTEVTVRKYCMLTLLRVFHDLIPGYKIKEDMLEQKLKKDNLKLVKQEIEFLAHYRKYLKFLEETLEDSKKEPNNLGLLSVGQTAVHCFGDLIVAHPLFNYNVNIIQAMVPYLNHFDDTVRNKAYSAFSRVIQNDKSCFLTLEIVKRIYSLTKRCHFKVKDEVLKVFHSLRLNEMKNSDLEVEQSKKTTKELSHREKLIKKLCDEAKMKPSRKQKKEKKKMAKLREQMAEINAKEIRSVDNFRHSEILSSVFGIYIHILKKKPSNRLMTIVLEGLAKFAHLINMEFFSDLLSLLGGYLSSKTLNNRDCLHCIQTVFTILSGQGETLNIDPLQFYKHFYALLATLSLKDKEENVLKILRIIQLMVITRKKKITPAKVLAFTKRLATFSFTLSHHCIIPSLIIVKNLLSTFPCTESLLDPDPEGSPGVFLPEISDPEHANASTTALWDMHLGLKHYHPLVRTLSTNILSGVPIREVPSLHSVLAKPFEKILEDFDPKNKFNPTIRSPEIHLQQFKKKNPCKQVLPNGEFDLNDLNLQMLCENVLTETEDCPQGQSVVEPPKKRMKTIGAVDYSKSTSLVDLNVYETLIENIDLSTITDNEKFDALIDFKDYLYVKK